MSIPPTNDIAKLQAGKALALAKRRKLFAALASRELGLLDVLALAETDKVVAQTRLRKVLAALPYWSVVRADAVMAELSIYEKRTMRGLRKEAKQRDALLAKVYRPRRRSTVVAPNPGWPYWGAAP